MAFRGKDFFTVIEFGTSKIAVAHCRTGQNGVPEVVGFASRDAENGIVKGEIVELVRIENLLAQVLADADSAAGTVCDRENVYYLVSGRGITSLRGEGNIVIYDEDKRITQNHIDEAMKKAMSVPIQPNMIDIDSFTSSFVLDMNTRVRDPLNHTANRLDAYIHIILAERNKVDTIRSMLREIGFEGKIIPVFTGVASAYGTLTRDEKEAGALVLDFGAGTMDYLGVVDDGVVAGGVIPVGTDNLANDLAVGLDLRIDQARKLLSEGRLDAARNAGESFLETAGSDVSRRKLPVASIEKIINARLQETFLMLKEELDARNLIPRFQSGLVMTGGGVLIPAVPEFASGILGLHKRVAKPVDFSGALTGLDNPRFSALTGSLKYIGELTAADGGNHPLGKVADVFENITGGIVDKFKNVTKAFSKI